MTVRERAAAVIATSSIMGAPISTTQVISTAVVGVGASKRLSAVRWGIVNRLLVAWLVTIPASACVSAAAFAGISLIQRAFG
jgi:PiT family inorganic phosphate transporter